MKLYFEFGAETQITNNDMVKCLKDSKIQNGLFD